MKRIVLLRHGESTWNKDNRFTGWTDVDLTEKGIADANQTGILLKEKGFHFDKAYTSFLKRAVKTLNCVLDKMDQDWIPVEKSWRLNEKHPYSSRSFRLPYCRGWQPVYRQWVAVRVLPVLPTPVRN